MTFMPPLAWLRERFYLDPAGVLRNAKNVGKAKQHAVVGTPHKDHGYVHVNIVHEGRKKKLAVHRVVWSLANGIPVPDDLEIDHKDRVRDHNLPPNLVLSTRRANMANTRFACVGVYRNPGNKTNPWRARTSIAGRLVNLGNHPTFEIAREAVITTLAESPTGRLAPRSEPNMQNLPGSWASVLERLWA